MVSNDELEQYMCKKYRYCSDCPAGMRSWDGTVGCSFENITECLNEYASDKNIGR